MKIMVAVPNFSYVNPQFVDSMFDLGTWLGEKYQGKDNQVIYCRDARTFRHLARAGQWEMARKFDVDGMLTIDDDMIFTAKDVELLIGSGADVCSAMYFVRSNPTFPCMMKIAVNTPPMLQYAPVMQYPDNGIIDVDAVGLGLCWISGKVIKALKAPYSREDQVADYVRENGQAIDAEKARTLCQVAQREVGEDVLLCENIRRAGFSIKVHTGSKIGHMSEEPNIITERDWRRVCAATMTGLSPKDAILEQTACGQIAVKEGVNG